MKAMLVAESISIQYSSANSSASNGVAERSNQTLSTIARALSISANLPDKAWPLSNDAASFLKNRLPTRRNPNNATPYERVHGVKPNLSHLRTYGCKAYYHQFTPASLKNNPRAKIGTMVGYDAASKRYRILTDPAKGTYVLTANVTFAETIMNLPGTLHSLPGFDASHFFTDDDEELDDILPDGPGEINVPVQQAAVPAPAPAVPVVDLVTPAINRNALAATTVPMPRANGELPPDIRNEPANPLNDPAFARDDDHDDLDLEHGHGDDFGHDFGHDFGYDGGPPDEEHVLLEAVAAPGVQLPDDVEDLLVEALQAPVRPQRNRQPPTNLSYDDGHLRGYRKVPKRYYRNVRGARITFDEALNDPS